MSRPPTGPVFGVEVAEHVGRHGQAYATFSYFENLMGQSLRDGLDDRAARLTSLTGDDWLLTGRDRGVSFVVGGKYVIGNGVVRPYLGAGSAPLI